MKQTKEELVTNKAKGYGTYREIGQDDFLPYVTNNERVVCHFYHKDFEKCKIIAMHLKEICQTHLETMFLTIDVEKSPFFVEKLAIQVLPTTIYFKDGIVKDRIVGFDFEGAGEKDDWPTMCLTRRLVQGGAIDAKNKTEEGRVTMSFSKGKYDNYSDDEDD